MSTERRLRWELTEPMPEGFRVLHHDYDEMADTMHRLITSAPEGESAWNGEVRHLPMRRVIEEREVSDWVEVDEPSTQTERPTP